MFRVLQECLGNVQKLAQAQAVEVLWRRNEEGCRLSVSDDGCGFDAEAQLGGHDGGVGLLGMRERAEMAGGVLSIDTRSGRGTCVTLKLPTRQVNHEQAEEELGSHPSLTR